MVDALQRNSLGLSLALHALVLLVLAGTGLSRKPLSAPRPMPIEITVVEQQLPALTPSKAVRAPVSERAIPNGDGPPRTASARRPQAAPPQTNVAAKPNLEADLAAARAARQRAERERLGRLQTSLGQDLPAGVAEPGAMAGDLSGRQLLSRVEPVYPEAARRDGAEGDVLLRVSVTPRGAVAGVTLVTRSGDARLDQAAIGAVSQWRFSALAEDASQEIQIGTVPIRFRLR